MRNGSTACGSRGRRGGFSLVEVCLAVLLVGVSVMTLFALFPQGMRMANEGTAETNIGMFAETVMAGLRANASDITDWTRWGNPTNFATAVCAGLGVTSTATPSAPLEFPAGSANYVKYTLAFGEVTGTVRRVRSCTLQVSNGKYGWQPAWFYTEFRFMGRP
jgi:type II secretory pathway pseudopilin PulG